MLCPLRQTSQAESHALACAHELQRSADMQQQIISEPHQFRNANFMPEHLMGSFME